MKEDKEELKFSIPNVDTIPCKYCKNKCLGILETYCKVYGLKPDSVYFESKPCPKFKG